MRKLLVITLALGFAISMTSFARAEDCTTIQDGTLLRSDGLPIETGFNEYGYNYQARISNQSIEEYCQQRNDIPEGQSGHWDYEDCMGYFGDQPFELIMKWNDAWLSNKDCSGDGLLDRHYGFSSYIGSGAWLTNHQKGIYIDDNGKKQRWGYFVKIVAAPANATNISGTWHAEDGTEIGPAIWGAFAIIQQVENDTGTGMHGVQYLSPYSAGFGKYSPQD